MVKLFHYCSLDVFQKIIEGKEIWFSDLLQSNDSSEGSYVLEILEEALIKFCDQENLHSEVLKEAKKFISNLVFFGTCLSKDGNNLSQWCRYADDGQGFSIGFEGGFRGTQIDNTFGSQYELKVADMEYQREKQIELFKPIVENILSDCDENRFKRSEFLIPKRQEIHPITLMKSFSPVAAYSVKHHAFEEEKETRFYFFMFHNDSRYSNCGYFCRDSALVPYIPIPLAEMPKISCIYLGPKNTTDLYKLKQFLCANDLDEVKIIESKIPYR